MVTEPVAPVSRVLEHMCVEGLVMGWRGVALGLSFLHDKVRQGFHPILSSKTILLPCRKLWMVHTEA